jgi:hypothetical protein
MWDDTGARRDPAFFTCLARGRRQGELLYGLSTGTVGGVFAYDVATGQEDRIAHSAEGPLNALATSDDHGVVAFARRHKNGSCNLWVMRDDGGDAAMVTDGDTLDADPSWVPVDADAKEGRHQLVYVSAGIGRGATGHIAGLAPSEVLLLDAERGQLKSIAADPRHDYLAPRMARDGTLYAMRRPYRGATPTPSTLATLKDGALFPFRLLYAGFRYLDFFSMRYSGRPLARSGDTKGRRIDARELLERGNVARGDDEDEGEGGEETWHAPAEWVLVARRPGGAESEVAKSIATYDVTRDGSLIVTDGASIERLDPASGKRERLARAKLVTAVVAI